jgi:hypothetical protein
MKQETHIPPFVLKISEVFSFNVGITVLLGELESGAPPVLAPCDVELIVGGQSRGQIRLESERMPGPHSKGCRVVETKANVHAEELLAQGCLLIHR